MKLNTGSDAPGTKSSSSTVLAGWTEVCACGDKRKDRERAFEEGSELKPWVKER